MGRSYYKELNEEIIKRIMLVKLEGKRKNSRPKTRCILWRRI
jgi:hypothetical protein